MGWRVQGELGELGYLNEPVNCMGRVSLVSWENSMGQ